jgi:uncharacterized protein (DUF736 family)
MANKRIGALWSRTYETDEGEINKYLSGVLDLGAFGEVPIVIFRNGRKSENNHPDMLIYRSSPSNGDERPPIDDPEDDPF